MTSQDYGRLTITLCLVAAALAFSAASITYARQGTVALGSIAAGIFLVAFGYVASRRFED